MDEAISSWLDELMDQIGVPAERHRFDVELLAWFEAETGLVLPDDFRYALPRMAGLGHNVLLPAFRVTTRTRVRPRLLPLDGQ